MIAPRNNYSQEQEEKPYQPEFRIKRTTVRDFDGDSINVVSIIPNRIEGEDYIPKW